MLMVIIFLTLVILSNKFVFSYAKYAYASTKDYFLKSKGFYFYSDKLKLIQINNSDSLWDGSAIHFTLNNNLNKSVVTDYDINYTVECEIEGEAKDSFGCKINGTESSVYSGTLSNVQKCFNETNDGVDVSGFTKTVCELNNYVWRSEVVNKDTYFEIFNKTSLEPTDIVVNIKAYTTSPYKKTLFGKFYLHKTDYSDGEITFEYENFSNSSKLVVYNSFNSDKCLKISWNPDHLIIGETKESFPYFESDSNNYIKSVKKIIKAKSDLILDFYSRNGIPYSKDEFTITTDTSC